MHVVGTRQTLALTGSNAGTDGIIKKIKETVGDKPVYLSIDVHPSFSAASSRRAHFSF